MCKFAVLVVVFIALLSGCDSSNENMGIGSSKMRGNVLITRQTPLVTRYIDYDVDQICYRTTSGNNGSSPAIQMDCSSFQHGKYDYIKP